MTEKEQKQKLETEKPPIDFMMTESMNQQLTTLNKLNKLNKGGEKDATNANANGSTT